MKHVLQKSLLPVAAAACLTWSTPSLACSTEDYISSICAMAAVTLRDFGDQFMWADGRILPINNYPALYALIGSTYGNIGSSTQFKLPDLRGRTVIGAGQGPGLPLFGLGEAAGNVSFTLTTAQLPAHAHSMATAAFDLSQLRAATVLSGLDATADLSNVQVSGPASGLTMMASNSNGSQPNPAGHTLGVATYTQGHVYTSDPPTVAMSTNSVGGNLSLTIANGTTAPVNISGSASTTIFGSISAVGNTGLTGGNQAVYFMPPYLAMKYYIAVTGLFPTND